MMCLELCPVLDELVRDTFHAELTALFRLT